MLQISHLRCNVQSSKDAATFFIKDNIKTNLFAIRSTCWDPLGLFSHQVSTKGLEAISKVFVLWVSVCVCVHVCLCCVHLCVHIHTIVCFWKSESCGNFVSFHQVGPKEGTWVAGFGGTNLPPLSRHACPAKCCNQLMVREGNCREDQRPVCFLKIGCGWNYLCHFSQENNKTITSLWTWRI